MLRNEAKPKKNIVIGVTLPYTARQDESVLSICKDYKRNLDITLLLLTLLGVGGIFFKYISVALTYFLIWMDVAIVVPVMVYTIAHKKLKQLKDINQWGSSILGKTLVEIKATTEKKQMLSIWWFVPPMVMSFIPVVYTMVALHNKEEFWWRLFTYLVMAIVVVVCYLFYRIVYRQTEVIDDNTNISAALARVRQYNWTKCWIWTGWLTGVYTLFFWLFFDQSLTIIIATTAYTIVLVYVVMRAEFETRSVQQKLTEDSGIRSYVDEDQHWIIGMFYYNQDDKHLVIDNRVGIGTTVNLAKFWGKVITGFGLICIIGMPFMGIWMMVEEFTPVTIEMTETQIIVNHLKEEYTIEFADIQSVELLEELPDVSKVVGSNFPTLYKGKFRVSDIGICNLCLNPKTGHYLLINTENNVYILGTNDTMKISEIFKQLNP